MKPRRRTRGMAVTDTLAHVLGPAQVGDYAAPVRPASDEEKARDADLRQRFRRVVGPDGSVRLEAVTDDERP